MGVMRLRPEFSDDDLILRNDGRTVTFGDKWVPKAYREDPNLVPRAIAHTVLHCILGHTQQSGDPARDLAEDMVVEYVLDSLDTPHISVDGRDERMYACEKIFKRAGGPSVDRMVPQIRELSSWQSEQYARMMRRDDHSARGSADPSEWDELSKQAMVEIEGFSKNIEGKTDALMAILRIRNRRRYDYRAFLRKFMTKRTQVKESLDEFDYIYYTYGLSVYGNLPLIDSLEYSDSPHVVDFVIAIDTSASTMRGPVMRFIEEAFEALRQCGLSGGKSNLHIIQCDEEVRSDDVVRSEGDMRALMSNFKLVGGKGTDFRPVFRYVDEMVADGRLRDLKGLMYFTDGRGTYPEWRPSYDTAFVFCDDGTEEHEVPAWAMRIVISEDELMRGHD